MCVTLQTAINVAEYLGLAIVLVVVVCRATGSSNEFLKHNYLWAVNLSAGGLCLLALSTMILVSFCRNFQAYRHVSTRLLAICNHEHMLQVVDTSRAFF